MRVTDALGVQIKAFSYDSQGNLIEELRSGADGSESISFSYDALNRLTRVVESGANGSNERIFEFDSLGNLLRRVNGNNATEYTFNVRNQLVEKVTDGTGRHIFTYDLRGNLISEELEAAAAPQQNGVTTRTTIASYTFDSTNRMVSGSNADGVASSYIYNGFGHLVGKESPDAKQFVLDYTMHIPTTLTENDIKYVYGLERISQTNSGNTLVYHNDRLGSAEKLTDLSGNVTASVRYDEWGKPSIIIPGLNPSFTGHEYDQVLGIYYARARFYDPITSRWLASDPYWDAFNRVFGELSSYPMPNIHAIMQSENLYVYCINNPLKYVDPDGQAILYELYEAGRDGLNSFLDALEAGQEARIAIALADAEVEHMRQFLRLQGMSYLNPFDPCPPQDEFSGFQMHRANSFMPSLSDIDMAYLFRWDSGDALDVVLFVAERAIPMPRTNTRGTLNAVSGGGNRRNNSSEGRGRPRWDTSSDRTVADCKS